jgi:hypothetical protein
LCSVVAMDAEWDSKVRGLAFGGRRSGSERVSDFCILYSDF